MNYIYDIVVNYKYPLIDFYEWSKSDKIINIKKMKIIKVYKKDLDVFKKYRFKIKDKISNCLLVDNEEAISFKFNKEGICIGKSKVPFDIENEALYITQNSKSKKLNYEVIKKDKLYNYQSKEEVKLKQNILKIISKIDNKDKLKYICYECLDRKIVNPKKELLKLINHKWDKYGLKIYHLLQLNH